MLRASKQDKFVHFQRSLEFAGISTSRPNSLLCPLCWTEKVFDELTLEHMVPGSVGGTLTTLTCEQCNNSHGSALDSHLSRYLRSLEAIEGHGMVDAVLDINGHRLRANFDAIDKNFHIIAKATDPSAQSASRAELASGQPVTVNVVFSFGFRENNFNTAILRSAYLILFKCFGYEYVRHDIVQSVRRRIIDISLDTPNLKSLILGLNFEPPWDAQHYVFEAMIDDVRCFVVVVRIRQKITKYLAACLPCPIGQSDRFFDLMEAHAQEHTGKKFEVSISPAHIFS